eukprot:CAMPEP_0182513710 /NCGR_PEP_ID=MMETSP1321-20130603/34466_1 /TAXON_ID=91990 /ORGANISM="Bolidomonas sp., Strain RCC1657" /LENGTH=538 /DNA_ID=CAMNT_0024720773 /DNA_START=153 /DNA_END=1766 /DNA_ORIENTATION=-
MEKVSPEPTGGTNGVLPGTDSDKSWHEILDSDGDGKVSAKDVNIALFLAGQTVPPNNFERVVNDPNVMGNFFDKQKFQEDMERFPTLMKERDSKLLTQKRYAIERWLQLSLLMGPFFLERFFPGQKPRIKRRRAFLKVVLGYTTMFLGSVFNVLPTILGVSLGASFQGLFRILAVGYALYYSLGFCLPIAVGESVAYGVEGETKNDSLYFKYSCLRYLKMKFRGQEIWGHEAYLTLTQSNEGLANSYIPPQYDRQDRVRRESTMQKIKQQNESNVYAQPISEQIVYMSVASIFACLGWYPVFLGREEVPGGVELVVCVLLTFGVFFGMHATYFIIIHRNVASYGESLQRLKSFRSTTTQRAIHKYDSNSFHPSKFVSLKDEDYDMMDELNLSSWQKMYDYICETTVQYVAFHQASTSACFSITVVMAAWALFISFTYNEDKERVLITLILLILLNLYTILKQLGLIVVINHTMHDDILKDLKYLRNIFRERARSEGSNTNDDAILSRLMDYIEHMESCPNRAGKLLGVTVKKSLLLKI